jgi:tetratricopeptide (TPR) repeat protein
VHPSRIRSGVGRYLARRLGGSGEEAGVDAGPSNRGAAANSTSQTKQCSAGRPARDYFETHSYVQTCVWIAARLAEALEHAHLRGILHRDLKPSNILIAADGTPMLLDFNLAVVVGEAGDSKASRLGGTVPYMSPEHLDAFNPMGNTRPEAVNERSDLYSLGLILYEMLAGILPFGDTPTDLRASWVMTQLLEERRKGVPSVRRHNPHVPYNLDSILRTCLDAKPERRYPSATVFAEDLRRFLEHRPLLHAPEPSPRERLKNWGKRHPRLSSAGSVGALTLFIIAMIAGGMQALSRSLAAAESRLAHTAFRHEFDRCQVFLNARRGAKAEWKQGIDRALSALRRYGVARGAPTDWLHGPLVRNLPSESQLALREEVAELAASLARARVNSIDVSARESRRRALEQAVGWLDRVEAIDPRPTAVLFRERAAYLEELGDETRAARDRKRALTLLPQTARDYSLIGEELASSGSIDQAIPFLERAIVIDPRRFWAWFVLGLCHYELGQFEAAAGEFGACMLIEPQFAWPAFNRGLALARAGRFTEARLAYDRAISLDPELIEARLNRALVDLERGAYGIALSDLDQVIASGHVTAAVHAARAEALDRLGRQPESEAEFAAAISLEPKNASLLVARGFARVRGAPDQAAEDFRQALRVEPESSRARLGLAMVLRHEDPARAIELLDQALERDASLHEALQLRAIERARRGDRGALEDIDRLERSPSALNLYNAACALCLLAERGQAGDLSRAAVLLRRAMDRGASASTIDRDPDLEILKREGHWPPKSELKTGPNHAAEAGGASTAA